MIADDIVAIPISIVRANGLLTQHVIAMADTVTRACFATLMAWGGYAVNSDSAKQAGSVNVKEDVSEMTIAIDVAFGSIRFNKIAGATVASVSVDVTIIDVSSGTEMENNVQMTVEFPAAPESESVVAIVDKARGHVIERLRSATTIIEGKSASALLFGDEA
jgi:hypothetical protein